MNEPIKVSHVWADFHPGLFAYPHEYLLSKGWDSKTFASALIQKNSAPPEEFYAYSTKELEHVNEPGLARKVMNKFMEPFFWKLYNKWIGNHEAFKGTKIIHAHFGQIGVRILPLLERTNLPLVVSFYGVDGSRLLREPKWVDGYKKMFQYTGAAVVLCEEVKTRLMNIGLAEDKIFLWRIPIELDTYKYQPRTPSDEVKFIIAARFVEKKGYPFVLEAFHRMLKEGKKVKLTMIGYGPERAQIEEDVSRRNLGEYTKIYDTKVQGNFPEFYNEQLKQHDIFLLPSTTAKKGDDEGGPALTLVAAQAAGLPVICTPFPGAEMSVIENETGLFCEFDDAESLYRKMNFLYDHPEEWNRLGEAGSRYVGRGFATEPQMEEMISIYKAVAAKHHGSEKKATI